MNNRYDVMILGTGEAGIFAAYELSRKCPGAKVLVVEQGADIYHRSCPIVAGKVNSCIQCKVCGTMCGGLLRREVQLHHRLRRVAHRLSGAQGSDGAH